MTQAIANQKNPTKPSRKGGSIRNRTPLAAKEKFVTLRARGLSFVKIAEEMGVARQTLLRWSQELQAEVATTRIRMSGPLKSPLKKTSAFSRKKRWDAC